MLITIVTNIPGWGDATAHACAKQKPGSLRYIRAQLNCCNSNMDTAWEARRGHGVSIIAHAMHMLLPLSDSQ